MPVKADGEVKLDNSKFNDKLVAAFTKKWGSTISIYLTTGQLHPIPINLILNIYYIFNENEIAS